MSGGAYDYASYRIEDLARAIHDDGCCDAASPELRRRFKALLRDVAAAVHAIEWNDSYDGDEEETAKILKCFARDGDNGRSEALEAAEAMERKAAALRAAFGEPGGAK